MGKSYRMNKFAKNRRQLRQVKKDIAIAVKSRRSPMISKLDMKYTFRQLSKKPGFVLLAILVLAGGLGISLISFTISYSMTYKELPITNGERIYHICARA